MPECGSPPTVGACLSLKLQLELRCCLSPPVTSTAPIHSASTVIPPTPLLPACGIAFTCFREQWLLVC